jgi:hypothetical protein
MFNRRSFLAAAGLGTATLFMPTLGRRGRAAPATKYGGPYFILIHASGGWDPTMVCDPKGGTINQGFQASEILTAGNIRYAPVQYNENGRTFSNQQFFDKWGPSALIINGLDTTTGNHDTGTRAVWSGRVMDGFPSFAAVVSAAKSPGNPLGFIANGGYEETGGLVPLTRLGNADTVRRLAMPNRVDPTNAGNQDKYASDATWERVQRVQRQRLDDLRQRQGLPRLQGAMSTLYGARTSTNEIEQLAAALPSNDQLNQAWNSLHRQALVALAGFKTGLSVAASLSVGGFDTHGNHDEAQGRALFFLMSGIDLILAEIAAAGMQNSVYVIVGSDFGRTPKYNSGNGKDHWNITSMMLWGPEIRGNRVVGATDDAYKAKSVDPATLAEKSDGTRIRPEHVQAALRKLAGISQSEPARQFPITAPELPLFT